MPFFFSSRAQADHGNNGSGGERDNTAAAAAAAAAANSNDDNENSNKQNDNKQGSSSSIGTRIRTFLLLHVLTALLPPVESKEELKKTEYYKVLGINDKNKRSVTPEQIRKAYKQKSLALHPDKVAQRNARRDRRHNNTNTAKDSINNLTEEEAAELFLKVQEAHAVLSDAHNRHVYHEFGCSPARYKFVHDTEGNGATAAALHHPIMLYENLTKASCVNKTRLVTVFTIFILLALLQPILICAKINQELNAITVAPTVAPSSSPFGPTPTLMPITMIPSASPIATYSPMASPAGPPTNINATASPSSDPTAVPITTSPSSSPTASPLSEPTTAVPAATSAPTGPTNAARRRGNEDYEPLVEENDNVDAVVVEEPSSPSTSLPTTTTNTSIITTTTTTSDAAEDDPKRTALVNTPWSVIFIPFWIFYGFIFMSIQLLLVCCWIRDSWQVRWFALQHLNFLIGIILLVQVWDGNRMISTTSWHILSTPFYLAILCRCAGMAQMARDLLDIVHTRMASLEHLQQTEPRPVRRRDNNSGNETHDDDDDEDDDFLEWIAQLSEKYVIVTPDPQIVEAHIMLWHEEHDRENNNINNINEEPASPTSSAGEIPEDEMESIRIASSLEYQSAMEQVQTLQRSAGNFFVYGIVMVALIAAKLTQDQLATKASWWAIFTPMWIYLGLQMMQALSLCCCSGLAAGNNDGVIILASAAAAASSSSAAGGDATGGNSQNQAGNDVENQQQQQGDVTTSASTTTTSTSSPNKNNKNDQFQDEHSPNREQKQQRASSSVNWANAEGSMKLPSIATTRAAAIITPKDHGDDNASLTPSDEGCFGQKRTADPPGMLAEEVVQQQQQQDPPGVAAAAAVANDDGQGGSSGDVSGINPPSQGEQQQQQPRGGGGHDGDDAEPHHNFDEETYHRWQQAHAAAESSAMEAQAKGQYQCCVAIFQLIILCLAVGKLQAQEEPSENAGYNAFWILFPLFFLAGILVCCCSCLIYSAGSASGLDDLVASTKKDDADNNEGNDTEGNNANQTGNSNINNMSTETSTGSSPTIPLAAPPASTQTTAKTKTQGELPGRPVATKHQPSAAAAAAAATVQPPTATVAGTVGVGGGDIENAMDDLD